MSAGVLYPDTATVDRLRELPDDGSRYEIIDGRLEVTPPASEDHQTPLAGVYGLLKRAAPAGWRVLWDIGLRFPDGDAAVPDLVVLAPETPRATADYNDVTLVRPALVVEIESRSTRKTDRGSKLVAYAEAGIPEYWRIERDGTAHVHALAGPGVYTLAATVKPGETWQARWPFPVTIDPSRLAKG
ncbi:MAG: Uma2 family endonuclease [Natronosporangium sp.]